MNWQTMTQFHQTGTHNLMRGGQPAHGHKQPVAGAGLPTMSNPNQPGFMAGPAFMPGKGAQWGNHLPDLDDFLQLDGVQQGQGRGQRGPFGEEQNPFSPRPRKKIMGYSQSQGAQTTRSGPLSPRTSYKPTSMLSRSQSYSR